jgi:pSer/pThr/pTyr-binding forkhead associated (FHA) protein
MIQNLAEILVMARTTSAAGFREKFPHPALTLWIPDTDSPMSDNASSLQMTMDDEGLDKLLLLIQKRNKVAWLTKSGNNFFANIISLGRAPTNDIQIPLETISKTHAFFSMIGGDWRVSDRGAKNGLFLNHSAIPPEQSMGIKNGDVLQFGQEVKATFHMPEGLHSFLNNLERP